MKIAIIGSRLFSGMSKISDYLDENLKSLSDLTIVSGGAAGVDAAAKSYALKRNISFIELKADWRSFGRAAGPVRNKKIVDMVDKVYAFWDGQSKGTLHVIEYAGKLGKPCLVLKNVDDELVSILP